MTRKKVTQNPDPCDLRQVPARNLVAIGPEIGDQTRQFSRALVTLDGEGSDFTIIINND